MGTDANTPAHSGKHGQSGTKGLTNRQQRPEPKATQRLTNSGRNRKQHIDWIATAETQTDDQPRYEEALKQKKVSGRKFHSDSLPHMQYENAKATKRTATPVQKI